jgi:hypothetical protein
MTNIVDFPSSSARRESRTFNFVLQRADNLRNALTARAQFDSADKLRVAQQIDRVLTERKVSCGLSPTEVARKAGLGGNNDYDSSKRLYNYRLPSNATEKRKDQIAKKPDRFFDLARAIAHLTDESEEVLLSYLFEGCSFGATAQKLPDWDTERWQILARLIEEMAQAVVRETALEAYWQDVSRMEVEFDVRNELFEAAWGPCDTYPLSYGLLSGSVCSDETPPIPSVAIARKPMAPSQNGIIILDGGEEMELEFSLHLEMRLALGPTTSISQIGPLIEFRSVLEAQDQQVHTVTFDNPFTDGSDTVREMRCDEKIYGVVQMPELSFPDAERRDFPEHSYFAWTDVSPALLRDVLSDSNHTVSAARMEAILAKERPPVRFERGSAAAKLHGELLDGTLEKLLTDACCTLKEGFETYQLKLRARILEAEAEARARWQRLSAHHEMEETKQ